MDLYRVGVPSIGETYLSRWTWVRGTGGLGTGVYAFRTRGAAVQNIESARHDKKLFVLEEALEHPLEVPTLDATQALNDFWRKFDRLARHPQVDLESIRDNPGEFRSLQVSLVSADEGEEVFQFGSRLGDDASTLITGIPALVDRYGSGGVNRLIDHAADSTLMAIEECDGAMDRTCVQPINKWLWPEYDGVCPVSGAGGDVGKFGCVIFKERVDACVDRETELFEEIPSEMLNACFRIELDELRAEIQERI